MPVEQWNESGRVWEEDHGLLGAEQVARCQRADVAEPLQSPVPTRMVSNGEYMPVPQTDQQKRVEARLGGLAEEASNWLVSISGLYSIPKGRFPLFEDSDA